MLCDFFGLCELLQICKHILVILSQFHSRLISLLVQRLQLSDLFLTLKYSTVEVNDSILVLICLLLHFVFIIKSDAVKHLFVPFVKVAHVLVVLNTLYFNLLTQLTFSYLGLSGSQLACLLFTL